MPTSFLKEVIFQKKKVTKHKKKILFLFSSLLSEVTLSRYCSKKRRCSMTSKSLKLKRSYSTGWSVLVQRQEWNVTQKIASFQTKKINCELVCGGGGGGDGVDYESSSFSGHIFFLKWIIFGLFFLRRSLALDDLVVL